MDRKVLIALGWNKETRLGTGWIPDRPNNGSNPGLCRVTAMG